MSGSKTKGNKTAASKPMTQDRASKIQSATAKRTGTVTQRDFAARAGRAAAKNSTSTDH